jgi:hypothetical protein
MPYLSIVLTVVCAIFYYRAAEFENEPGILWCGLSVLISAVTLLFFKWGWLGHLLGQVGFFSALQFFARSASHKAVSLNMAD